MYLRLLLSPDPQHALEQSHVIERAQAGRLATVDRLTGAEKHADTLAARSRALLDRQRKLVAQQRKHRDTVRSRLDDVEALLASLTPEQLAALSDLEERNTEAAQDELVASGALSSARPPSRQGGDAVRYAIGQIGKPYVWGAEGPDAYDCSGLTSQAWSAAGLTIPRTSQEQWRQLPKVPVASLRPGDLVVYFPKATHVALYIGDGLVVQAPRPGASVKVSPGVQPAAGRGPSGPGRRTADLVHASGAARGRVVRIGHRVRRPGVVGPRTRAGHRTGPPRRQDGRGGPVAVGVSPARPRARPGTRSSSPARRRSCRSPPGR